MKDSTTTHPRRDSSCASGKAARTSVGVLEVEHHAAAVVAVQRLARRPGSRSGRPTRTAWSAVRTDSDRGTGRPAAASSRVVSSLSPAMSTASAEVLEVIVARIRRWWTPWPSCTRECWFSRSQGMSRDTASSRIAWVDGPNAVRSACTQEALELGGEVELRLGLHEVVDEPYGQRPGGQADLLVDVPVDDVVLPRTPVPRVLPRRMSCPASCCSCSATCSATCPSQVPSLSRSRNPPRCPREQVCRRCRAAPRPDRRRSRGSCRRGGPPATRGRRRGGSRARTTRGWARGRPGSAGSRDRAAGCSSRCQSSSVWCWSWAARCSSTNDASRRSTRSNRAPAGRVCTTTPDTSIGARARRGGRR